MKKFRIGIIGTENSHADGFVNLINKPDENGNLRYPDCHVTLVYGHYPEASQKLVDELGADAVASSIEEMVNNVDAVMVTARDGKFHYEFVKPFIEAGIPAFIDKPFTVNPEEAKELIALAKEKNVPLCGGSSLKFADAIEEMSEYVKETGDAILGGNVVAPLYIDSEYGGFFFYASHLTEMTLEVFGYNPCSISAFRNKAGVCAIINYDNFSVSNHFNQATWLYSVSAYTADHLEQKKIDLSMAASKECDAFVEMLRTGKMAQTYEQLVIPVYYMNAVKKAYETGENVYIEF